MCSSENAALCILSTFCYNASDNDYVYCAHIILLLSAQHISSGSNDFYFISMQTTERLLFKFHPKWLISVHMHCVCMHVYVYKWNDFRHLWIGYAMGWTSWWLVHSMYKSGRERGRIALKLYRCVKITNMICVCARVCEYWLPCVPSLVNDINRRSEYVEQWNEISSWYFTSTQDTYCYIGT